MTSLILHVIGWPAFLLALLVFGFAPGALLRLIVLAFDRDDPRRQELLAELYAVSRIERPFWVAEQLEVALIEGLGNRVRRHTGKPGQPPHETVLGLPALRLDAGPGRIDRAVRYLASDAAIRQFIAIGADIPTVGNVHDVAQKIAPECRIVYADDDPSVLAHARALLTSTPEGACDYIDADLRDPVWIIAFAATTLDFSQPIALLLIQTREHSSDNNEPDTLASQLRLVQALPAGSFLVF